MQNTPNMTTEIIEAVVNYFNFDEDILSDTLLCLTNLTDSRVSNIAYLAQKELIDMGRCPYCGEKLETAHYKEQHNEIEGCPYEEMSEVYCPNCDFKG